MLKSIRAFFEKRNAEEEQAVREKIEAIGRRLKARAAVSRPAPARGEAIGRRLKARAAVSRPAPASGDDTAVFVAVATAVAFSSFED